MLAAQIEQCSDTNKHKTFPKTMRRELCRFKKICALKLKFDNLNLTYYIF